MDWFDKAEKRAMELASVVPIASEYVGICGAGVAFDSFDIVEAFTLPSGRTHRLSAQV